MLILIQKKPMNFMGSVCR